LTLRATASRGLFGDLGGQCACDAPQGGLDLITLLLAAAVACWRSSRSGDPQSVASLATWGALLRQSPSSDPRIQQRT
jgi:hypothetical protein